MNVGFGIFTLMFILITTAIIYIKQKTIRNVIWNSFRFIVVGISFYWGRGASQVWEILLWSIIIGACLIISVIHAYNMLFSAGITYESIGTDRKPKSFGNGYWK